MNSAEYGHMHLSIFHRKILKLHDRGMIIKSRFYPWSAIEEIELWQEPWPGYGQVPDVKLLPRARIFLAGGENILLRGDVLVKNESRSPDCPDTFNELIAYLMEMHKLERNIRSASTKGQ